MQDLNKPIVVDGVTYEPDEFYKRTLLVHGSEPTNYEDYPPLCSTCTNFSIIKAVF